MRFCSVAMIIFEHLLPRLHLRILQNSREREGSALNRRSFCLMRILWSSCMSNVGVVGEPEWVRHRGHNMLGIVIPDRQRTQNLFKLKGFFQVEEEVGVETDCSDDDAHAPAMSKYVTKI